LNLQFYGLRTGILTQLLFLIIAAMLLVNVAMLNLSQRHLLQSKADAGKFLIQALALNIGHLMDGRDAPIDSLFKDKAAAKETSDLLLDGGFTHLVILDTQGGTSFSTGSSDEENRILLSLARISMQETETSVNYRGNTWGVFWLSRKEITVSGQMTYHGRTIGAAAISSPLESIYQSLRKSERLVLLYIIFDTIILALVGIYLLSRIVVKPIHRLLKMTDKYMEGDILPPLPEDTGNEIGNLSRSLNIMLQRLDENKQELKRHISSLEKANLDLKLAQNEVIRSEKLASVGRLAAGLAHEIGNPLGIILGYLELIRKADITDEEKRDFLNRVESEITRINIIIRQLLDFSRPSGGNDEEKSIHEIIVDTANLMRPHPLMEGINILMDLKAKKDTVFSESGKLQQVFLNIIMNATDVLKESSHPDKDTSNNLIITTDNIDDTIEIRFIDNGPGIEEDKIQHIFDPFYTTKEPGKGTGLGLSVSYMIIEAQGGKIRAESAKGNGMAIIINLPVHEIPTQGDR
jgi:two-component system NtrC family sensor kinase